MVCSKQGLRTYHSGEEFVLFYFLKNTTCKKYFLLAKCEILPIQSISQWHFVHECFKNTLPSILCQSGLYCTLYIAHTCLVCGHYRKIQSWLIFRQSHCTSHITVTILPCKACLPQRLYFNSKKGRKEMGYLWPTPASLPFSQNTSLMFVSLRIRDI